MTTAKPAACFVGWWHAPATQGQRVHGLWAIATLGVIRTQQAPGGILRVRI